VAFGAFGHGETNGRTLGNERPRYWPWSCCPLDVGDPRIGMLSFGVDFDRGVAEMAQRSYAVTRLDAGRTLPQAVADSRGSVLRDTRKITPLPGSSASALVTF